MSTLVSLPVTMFLLDVPAFFGMFKPNPLSLVAALVGMGGIAVILIWKRRTPRPATPAPIKAQTIDKTPKAEEAMPDLLAEAETEAIAATLAERAAQRSAEAPEPPPEEDTEPIAWDEDEETYAPVLVDTVAFLRSLGLEPPSETLQDRSQVFIRRSAYAQVRAHLADDLDVEQGGLLIGPAHYDPQRRAYLLLIEEALPAQEGIETPTSFSYTSASWESLTPRLQAMDPDWTLLGSYHSHPGMGVFLSETDRDTQAGIFSQEWQLALVVDPVADSLGFFIGASEKPCEDWRLVPDRSA